MQVQSPKPVTGISGMWQNLAIWRKLHTVRSHTEIFLIKYAVILWKKYSFNRRLSFCHMQLKFTSGNYCNVRIWFPISFDIRYSGETFQYCTGTCSFQYMYYYTTPWPRQKLLVCCYWRFTTDRVRRLLSLPPWSLTRTKIQSIIKVS